MSKAVAEVLLDGGLDRPLDYSVPKDLAHLEIGMRVSVPLQTRKAKGTILALKKTSIFKTLKPLEELHGEKPLVSKELFQLAKWVANYYCCPLGKVLRSILPPVVRDEKAGHKTQSFVKPLISQNEMKKFIEKKRNTARAKVLDVLIQSPKGLLLTELLEKANTSNSPIQTLAKNGVLQIQEMRIDRSPIHNHEFFPTKPKKLSEEQKCTLDAIDYDTFKCHLIHGVTGSGKTEVYLQAIQQVLNEGKGVIYLVPEIALTAQTIERFKGRFGEEKIAILHHRLSSGERFDAWHGIQSGKMKIVIGARSCIFSPVQNLGLIVVDEEHEASYKQSDEAPKYSARDVAIVRAKFSNCPILLGSATPSIESYTNAKFGKYKLHILASRADSASLPTVNLVDMQKEWERNKGFTLFSDRLIQGIKKRLEVGEQTLLFLNRRGYHTSAHCQKCSHVMSCPHCDLSLTYHLGEKILACHLCDYRIHPPRECPSCKEDGALKFKGAGTEMVEKALYALFPDLRVLRLDADTTKHKGAHERIFKQFRSGKADILIGTQMIAKGLHFPMVTLVGVLGTDGSLNIPDFRASENVFQLLTQVAGRSGRGSLKGEVLIQTHMPENATIQFAKTANYEGFYNEEIETRKLFHFPPFTHLVKFSFSGENLEKCERRANAFRKMLVERLPGNVEILPLTPCGYTKIKGRYRYQCLIKVEKIQTVLKQIELLRSEFGQKKGVYLSIDVDPQTTFF